MKLALQIFSWIAIILGALALVFATTYPDPAPSIIGGGLFLAEGILALVYINSTK